MSCTLPRRSGCFPISKEPNVGCDTGVVEELLWQGNKGFQQIVLEYIAAYLTLAAGSVSGKKGRPVHNDGDTRAAFTRVLGAGEHMQQEQKLTIADMRGRPGPNLPAAPRLCSARTVLSSRFQSFP